MTGLTKEKESGELKMTKEKSAGGNLHSNKNISNSIIPQKSKKVGFVYETTEYGLFKLDPTNRDIKKIDGLVNQAKTIGIVSPIIVDENMIVYDGQHRLEASKVAKTPIKYIVIEGVGAEAMIGMNTNSSNWKLIDYANHYAKMGFIDYQDIIELANTYDVTVSQIAEMQGVSMAQGSKMLNRWYGFQNGKTRINKRYVEETLIPYGMFINETGLKQKSATLQAFSKLYNISKFDLSRFIQKINNQSSKYEINKFQNKGDVLAAFLDVYNHQLQRNSKFKIDFMYDENKKLIITSPKKKY